jgi:hypothetical protein
MDFTIDLTDSSDEETRQAVLAPLVEYNDSKAGASGYGPLAVLVKDAEGAVVGGLWGGTAYGWLFTQLLVVP